MNLGRTIFYLISIVGLLGCNSKQKQKENFNAFTNTIVEIKLPIAINCKVDLPGNKPDTNLFRNFIPIGFSEAAQLKVDSNTFLFVFSKTQPTSRLLLFTTDDYGNFIDSLNLISCNIKTRIEKQIAIKIDLDLEIEIERKTDYFSYMQHGTEYIRGLDSTKTKRTVYKLNTKGKLVLL